MYKIRGESGEVAPIPVVFIHLPRFDRIAQEVQLRQVKAILSQILKGSLSSLESVTVNSGGVGSDVELIYE